MRACVCVDQHFDACVVAGCSPWFPQNALELDCIEGMPAGLVKVCDVQFVV